MTALDRDDLQAFLQQHLIPAEIIILASPTPTVETAAHAVSCLPEQIVKSLLFLVDANPVLAITNGLSPVEPRRLAAHFAVGRKKIKLAGPHNVLEITGYPVGTVPPFGHRQPLPTLLDPGVFAHDLIFAGGGAHNALLRISPQLIQKVTGAALIALHDQANQE
ncbi:MAG: YbaK/EbsC family protein [Anaerolineae bacterium]|nr:YbaK/EbsC family protein [Anaerolineae bacterium]